VTFPHTGPFQRSLRGILSRVRTRLWVAGLASGALAAVLLGIPMLAAHQTTRRTAPAPPDFYVLNGGIEAVFKSVAEPPPGLSRTVNVPCLGMQRLLGESEPAVFTTSADRPSVIRLARCLHRHGFLSTSDLALALGTRPTLTRHGIGRVVPLSLQLEPSALALSSWGALLGLELVGALVLIRASGRRRRQSTS